MNQVRVIGSAPESDWCAALTTVSMQPAWCPYDERAIDFVADVAGRLLSAPAARSFPEAMALGHWFRRASLLSLSEKFRERVGFDVAVRGRGMVFHLAPANVDSIFLYSSLISLLAGNTNVVRLPMQHAPAMDLFVATLQEAIGKAPGFGKRLLLLGYGHDDQVTKRISDLCQVRVIWGGDATVRHIRSLALPPTAVEFSFPDRFSLAAIEADAAANLDDEGMAGLARNVANDAFLFNQQACSSPRLIAWVGRPDRISAAKERFWPALQREIARRQFENTAAMGMDRLVAAYEYAARALAAPAPSTRQAFPVRLECGALRPETRDLHCGNGIFLELDLADLLELAPQLSERDQTLAVFGFDRQTLLQLVDRLPARAIDRIVPIGQALVFSMCWDGINLEDALTRRIVLS